MTLKPTWPLPARRPPLEEPSPQLMTTCRSLTLVAGAKALTGGTETQEGQRGGRPGKGVGGAGARRGPEGGGGGGGGGGRGCGGGGGGGGGCGCGGRNPG